MKPLVSINLCACEAIDISLISRQLAISVSWLLRRRDHDSDRDSSSVTSFRGSASKQAAARTARGRLPRRSEGEGKTQRHRSTPWPWPRRLPLPALELSKDPGKVRASRLANWRRTAHARFRIRSSGLESLSRKVYSEACALAAPAAR